MGHHEVDKFRHPRFFSARTRVARNNDVGQSLEQGIFGGRKELRLVACRPDLQCRVSDVPASQSPLAESGEVRGRRSRAQNTQYFPPLNALTCHSLHDLRWSPALMLEGWPSHERNLMVCSIISLVGL